MLEDIVKRLRDQADEIDRAVSRNKDEIDEGSFCEIEYMREAALEIERLRAIESRSESVREMCAKIAEPHSQQSAVLIRAAPMGILE